LVQVVIEIEENEHGLVMKKATANFFSLSEFQWGQMGTCAEPE
jgi:hypothetical protein